MDSGKHLYQIVPRLILEYVPRGAGAQGAEEMAVVVKDGGDHRQHVLVSGAQLRDQIGSGSVGEAEVDQRDFGCVLRAGLATGRQVPGFALQAALYSGNGAAALGALGAAGAATYAFSGYVALTSTQRDQPICAGATRSSPALRATEPLRRRRTSKASYSMISARWDC